jgi:predicted dehydrogenase
MLAGDATSVTCRTQNRFGYDGIEDVAVASFGHADGVVSNLVSVWHQIMTRPSTRRLEVFCEDAMLWTEDDNTGPLHIHTSQGAEEIACALPDWVSALPVPPEMQKPLGLYAEASRRFLAAVSTGSTGSPGGAQALQAHRVVDAAYRSAASDGASVVV